MPHKCNKDKEFHFPLLRLQQLQTMKTSSNALLATMAVASTPAALAATATLRVVPTRSNPPMKSPLLLLLRLHLDANWTGKVARQASLQRLKIMPGSWESMIPQVS